MAREEQSETPALAVETICMVDRRGEEKPASNRLQTCGEEMLAKLLGGFPG